MSEIDVSKCDRYNDFPVKRGVSQYAICLASFEQWGGADQKFCKDRPNCYYKQLQQLKQQLQLEKDNVAELNELLISYKEENEELKNLLKYYFKDNSSNYDNFYDICSANGKCNGSCRYEQ